MNLNAQIVLADLAGYCVKYAISGDRLSRNLRFPVIWNGENTLLGDRLYLARGDELPLSPRLENHPAIICVGPPPDVYYSKACDTIAVDECLTLEALLSKMQEAFERYTLWEVELQCAVINNEPIKTLGILSETILKNPVKLYDVNLKCLFHITNSNRQPIHEDLMVHQEDGFLSIEDINLLKTDRRVIETSTSKEPVLHDNTLFGHRVMSLNIFFDGKQAGQLILEEIYRKFGEWEYSLLTILAQAVLNAMINSNSINLGHPKHIEYVLGSLLSRSPVDVKAIEDTLLEMDWQQSDSYFCTAIEPTEYDRTGRTLVAITSELARITASECYTTFDDRIVFIFNLSALKSTRREVLKQIVTFLREGMLMAGISTSFSGFDNIYNYYTQARIALERGKEVNNTIWFHFFDDYILDHILSSGQTQLNADALCPEGLTRLREYDNQKKANLVETLRVYLNSNMSVTESARKLYLHRNSFLYKLSKIKEILQMDMKDSNTRLLLQIVLEMIIP